MGEKGNSSQTCVTAVFSSFFNNFVYLFAFSLTLTLFPPLSFPTFFLALSPPHTHTHAHTPGYSTSPRWLQYLVRHSCPLRRRRRRRPWCWWRSIVAMQPLTMAPYSICANTWVRRIARRRGLRERRKEERRKGEREGSSRK